MLYLAKANAEVRNTAVLKAMRIQFDHPKLAQFAPTHGDGWDDRRSGGDEFYEWGRDAAGHALLRGTVATWIRHINIGDQAARVLTEYIDSRIQCFDNTQHPNLHDIRFRNGG